MLNFPIYDRNARLKSDVDSKRQFKLLEICLIHDNRMYDNENRFNCFSNWFET